MNCVIHSLLDGFPLVLCDHYTYLLFIMYRITNLAQYHVRVFSISIDCDHTKIIITVHLLKKGIKCISLKNYNYANNVCTQLKAVSKGNFSSLVKYLSFVGITADSSNRKPSSWKRWRSTSFTYKIWLKHVGSQNININNHWRHSYGSISLAIINI